MVSTDNTAIDVFLDVAALERYYNILILLNVDSANFAKRVWW
jgi:hypothetical protein